MTGRGRSYNYYWQKDKMNPKRRCLSIDIRKFFVIRKKIADFTSAFRSYAYTFKASF